MKRGRTSWARIKGKKLKRGNGGLMDREFSSTSRRELRRREPTKHADDEEKNWGEIPHCGRSDYDECVTA